VSISPGRSLAVSLAEMAAEKDTTQYVLYYYNGRGLAEPIRMLLSYGGAIFEDRRTPITSFTPITPLPAEWKQRALFGQVPILEFEGKQITQSLAITRYLARRYKLVGKDDFEAAKCDELADGAKDFFLLWVPSYREDDEVKKQAIYDQALGVGKERYLPKFRSVLEANGGNNLVGDSLTWADIYVAYFLDQIKRVTNVNILEDYPELQAFVNDILSTAGVKDWIEKRPETRF
jgi:glutathione S-transferase